MKHCLSFMTTIFFVVVRFFGLSALAMAAFCFSDVESKRSYASPPPFLNDFAQFPLRTA